MRILASSPHIPYGESPIPRMALAAATACLFVLSFIGYGFCRFHISSDLFGGDSIRFARSRMTSYLLSETDIQDFPYFCASFLQGRTGGTTERNKEKLILGNCISILEYLSCFQA